MLCLPKGSCLVLALPLCKKTAAVKYVVDEISFYPTTSAISEWFDARRGLALGTAVSGASVGGIFWPPVIGKLYHFLSPSWLHRIIALISTPLLLLSCWMIRERKDAAGHDKSGREVSPEQQSVRKAILEWRFIALSLSLFLLYGGLLIPFYYVTVYAQASGVNDNVATCLVVLVYSGSAVGRILAGWLADKFGRLAQCALLVVNVDADWTQVHRLVYDGDIGWSHYVVLDMDDIGGRNGQLCAHVWLILRRFGASRLSLRGPDYA